jgi:hypothetical protein
MKQVIFYTKQGCHLCEEACKLLMGTVVDVPLQIDVVDISFDHNRDFHAKYFLHIPVLTFSDTGRELTWPFTAADIVACLNQSPKD